MAEEVPHNNVVGEESPAPRQHSAGLLKKILLSLLLAGLLLGAGAYLGFGWLKSSLNQPLGFSEQVFKIEKGDTPKRFIAQLKQAGVVEQTLPFVLYARYKGLAGKLHTGQYRFDDGMNQVELLEAVTTGKNRLQLLFTFVQGSSFRQLRQSLAQARDIQTTIADMDDGEVQSLFDPDKTYPAPEGLFFPETYAYDPGATDQDILGRAYAMMQSTLRKTWEARYPDIEIESPYEALILASIIEKETALEEERKLIAGVFMNRLRKGMKLQTDPTVIYGLGEEYDGDITREHLRRDTPYNTYTRNGLPPTPICMPGRAAIEAAVQPATTDALFFVAKGDGSGGHTFSKTLSEHNRAVKNYLKASRTSG